MIYPYTTYREKIDGDLYWVAKSRILKHCIGQGETVEQAVKELEENEKAWIETAKEVGIKIPEVPVDSIENYSGKMTLRIAPSVHMEAAMLAMREGISLNQYINDAIVNSNAKLSMM